MQSKNEIVLYQPDEAIQLEVRLENETVWLSQQQMSILFEIDRTSIVRHINNIYRVKELDPDSTCVKIAQVQLEGGRPLKACFMYHIGASIKDLGKKWFAFCKMQMPATEIFGRL